MSHWSNLQKCAVLFGCAWICWTSPSLGHAQGCAPIVPRPNLEEVVKQVQELEQYSGLFPSEAFQKVTRSGQPSDWWLYADYLDAILRNPRLGADWLSGRSRPWTPQDLPMRPPQLCETTGLKGAVLFRALVGQGKVPNFSPDLFNQTKQTFPPGQWDNFLKLSPGLRSKYGG